MKIATPQLWDRGRLAGLRLDLDTLQATLRALHVEIEGQRDERGALLVEGARDRVDTALRNVRRLDPDAQDHWERSKRTPAELRAIFANPPAKMDPLTAREGLRRCDAYDAARARLTGLQQRREALIAQAQPLVALVEACQRWAGVDGQGQPAFYAH